MSKLPAIPTMASMSRDGGATFDVALEGGGTKGIALNAALAELFARGHRIRRIVGTSAGSIAATLVAAGISADELVRVSLERTDDDLPLFAEWAREPLVPLAQFSELRSEEPDLFALSLPGEAGHRLTAARAAVAFLDRGGFVSGDGFVLWLCAALERREPGLSRATLGELYARTGMHLTIVATNTTARRLRALNHGSATGSTRSPRR